MVFPFEEIPSKLRTHRELVEHGKECLNDKKLLYVYGAQFVTPLAALPKFNIVEGMVQDFLHNVPFGIGRTFLDEWLTNTSRSFYIGSPDELLALNKRINQLTPCIEVRRPVRPISVCAHWNAREYENWILFYSIPVLSDILPARFLNHWICFVQAIYLLSRQSISHNDVNIAHKLLIHFVSNVQMIYGKKYMTFNVHILLHLAQNATRWGPTWAVSTWCFESAIGVLKRLLHAQRGVYNQVERALSYKQAMAILLRTCRTPKTEVFLESIVPKPNKMTTYLPLKECVVIGKPIDFVPDDEEKFLITQSEHDINLRECVVYSKIIASRCVYTTEDVAADRKFNNSTALTASGELILIKKFILDKESEKVYLFSVNVCCDTFLKFPTSVRIPPQDHCSRIITSIGTRLKLLSVKDLKIVCVKSCMDGKMYVSPFHNLYNVC